jgi:D-alanine--poly(phosphoribitol) ligase subunit 2
MQDQLTSLILEVAAEIRQQDPAAPAAPLTLDTPLFGADGAFDSMGLVSLIVAVEQAIEEKLGATVALADEKALSQKSSPYRTVRTLAAYAAEQIGK